jgi:hypothetical protein
LRYRVTRETSQHSDDEGADPFIADPMSSTLKTSKFFYPPGKGPGGGGVGSGGRRGSRGLAPAAEEEGEGEEEDEDEEEGSEEEEEEHDYLIKNLEFRAQKQRAVGPRGGGGLSALVAAKLGRGQPGRGGGAAAAEERWGKETGGEWQMLCFFFLFLLLIDPLFLPFFSFCVVLHINKVGPGGIVSCRLPSGPSRGRLSKPLIYTLLFLFIHPYRIPLLRVDVVKGRGMLGMSLTADVAGLENPQEEFTIGEYTRAVLSSSLTHICSFPSFHSSLSPSLLLLNPSTLKMYVHYNI